MQSLFLQLTLLASLASGYWLPETLGKGQFKTCVVPKSKGDDSPTIISTVQSCGANSRIVFSAGTEYSLLTPLKFSHLTNVEFSIEGNLTLSDNPATVSAVVQNRSVYPGHWITVSNSQGVTFTASGTSGGGWIIGHGDKWWPSATDSSNNGRPHFFSFGVTGLRLRGLKVLNPVAWVFSMGGNDVYMTDTLLDARSMSAFPFNTDGIDVSASNVVIDGWKSYNGDDIINVSPPAVNVTMRNIVAYGTHGISVSCASGSGSQYLFENAEIHDSLLGARFKGSVGTTCQISDVTWRNMTITNTAYPIHFIEDYVDQEKGAAGKDASLAAFAKNFKWESITAHTGKDLKDGSCVSNPCWSKTLGESTKKGMYIICKDAAHCQDFHFSDITLVAADGSAGEMQCVGLENDKGLGIPCTNGTLAASK
ncbi:exopolygalacturonase C 1 [Colletotrichum truncatum]|uniref:Exopolygalacturonase C 1 n=1 Tax=Colletotrichum truncatum TaxID=5467 RepID=A0ACC3ZKT3_COLTU|nr:exopolygalacturonase C 1 [Colletotrichum truncatum]KAF6800101.1 exopolygalacturonase C 1 [Colletotrichum truncatum]